MRVARRVVSCISTGVFGQIGANERASDFSIPYVRCQVEFQTEHTIVCKTATTLSKQNEATARMSVGVRICIRLCVCVWLISWRVGGGRAAE